MNDNTAELAAIRKEVADLKDAVKELVEAWNTARGVVRFVKWLGTIATAASAIGVAAKVIWSK